MSDELLDRIREAPDDVENYLVYGDYLAQRGDPRGELIGFQHALASDPANTRLAARVAQLIEAQLASLPVPVEATWRLGFLRELTLDGRALAKLPELLAHPLLQIVEGISAVDRTTTDTLVRFRSTVGELLVHAPTTLRKLELGAIRSPLFDNVGELQKVLAKFPRLVEFGIWQRELPKGVLDVLAPIAEAVELGLYVFPDALLRDIATRSWPKLRALSLHFPQREHDAKRPTALAPLMVAKTVPALRDLRVRERGRTGGFTDRFCTEVVRSRLLAQLEVLDFSVVGLDLDAVRPSYPKLRHLERLLPSAEQETDINALEQMAWLLEEPDTERAIVLCRRLAQLAMTNHERHNIYRRLGTCLCLLSRLDEALDAHDESLSAETGCGVTWLQKAWVLKRLGRLAEAVDAIKRATNTPQHPASKHRVRYLAVSLGLALGRDVERSEIEATRDLYAAELETSVVDADLFYEHACLLALLGDNKGALSSLAHCFELCPPYKAWARDEVDLAAVRKLKTFRKLVSEPSGA